MLQTYKAILRGDRLEWDKETPRAITINQPVAVHVTILDEDIDLVSRRTSGQQMAAILEQLAQHTTLASVKDPVAWQREQRIDNDLPGRET